MQRKHLIVLTLVTVLLLLGFNIINNKRHEQSRAAQVTNDVLAANANAEIAAENNDNNETNASSPDDIAGKSIGEQPLGEQPAAILDKATTQIEQAENVEQQRLEQMESAQ